MSKNIESHIKGIIDSVEPNSKRLSKTPSRSARAYGELLDGYEKTPKQVIRSDAIYQSQMDDIVTLKNIAFESFCEHHMIAITGYVNIGYIPNGIIIGASKLARIVDCFSHRLQLQERFTIEIADAVQDALKPKGVAVYVEGRHFCISNRGVKKQDARLVTRYFLGDFKQNFFLRNEFISSF